MCLAIPGQVLEVVDEANRLAQVDVAGVRRNVNVGLLDDDDGRSRVGDWVLIHVGFAISKVDEEEALATLRAARGDGRRLRAGARGAEGERDRVRRLPAATPLAVHAARTTASPAATRESRCASCGIDDERELALCADDGRRAPSTVEIALVQPVAVGDALLVHAGTAIARLGEEARAMRFVDEFRDAELGRALAGEILAAVEPGPPLQGDGGVRRPHPLDLQVRDRRPAARRTSSSSTAPAARSA